MLHKAQTFTYDPLNRLLSAQNAGTNCAATTANGKTEYWGNSYTYDAWGNLLQKSVTKCSAENAILTMNGNNQALYYSYDAAGNMVNDGIFAYTFDQENRITGAAGYTYTYDDDGNRVRKSNGNLAGGGTLYWYMTPGVVAESDLAGTTKSEYIFFGGERVARRDGVNGAGGVFYYISDHLKTASIITDSAGTIKAESDYYPWGGELQITANDSNHYKFTGKERDGETGLDYFGARYYSGGLGRFMTPDWAAKPAAVPYAVLGDPQTLNLYGYVRNIPTTKADLDGHCQGDDCSEITVTAAKVGEPKITPRASGAGRNSAEVAGHINYTLKYNGKLLTNTQVHEHIKPTTTKNGHPVKATLQTGTGNTQNTGQVLDKVSIGTEKAAQPPFVNSAANDLATNAWAEKQTQVLTFSSPSGETCSVTENRTLTNADANGHASDHYTLNLNSPETQTAKPVPPPKSKAIH